MTYEVVEECGNYYYKNDADNDGHNYCIEKCADVEPTEGGYFFISGNKKCESDCSNFNMNKHYYDPDNNECLDTCKGRAKPFQNGISTETQKCLGSCNENDDDKHNHDFDSNICISNCGDDSSINLYHKEGEKICYPSCLSIPGGQYIYEFDNNICKASEEECNFYFIKNDGVRKCIDAQKCKDDNNVYLIGKQCTKGCDDYYKYEDTSLISESTFLRCFLTPDDCQNYFNTKVYYNKKLKKCWNSYPEGYYINSDESDDIVEVVEECENYYYKVAPAEGSTDVVKYYCIDKCKDQSQYFIKTKKKLRKFMYHFSYELF